MYQATSDPLNDHVERHVKIKDSVYRFLLHEDFSLKHGAGETCKYELTSILLKCWFLLQLDI